jgi:phage host-nuclease inhibitor protein Gam
MNFIEELYCLKPNRREMEHKVEMDKLRADQMLAAVEKLDEQMNDVIKLAEDEIKLIEEYRKSELEKLDKKRSWLCWNLEQYIRSTSEKTISLPHGQIKLRQGRQKVQIIDMDKFLKVGDRLNLLRKIPESIEPDLPAIHHYIKTTGEIPRGVDVIPAETKFSYSLTRIQGGKNNGK